MFSFVMLAIGPRSNQQRALGGIYDFDAGDRKRDIQLVRLDNSEI